VTQEELAEVIAAVTIGVLNALRDGGVLQPPAPSRPSGGLLTSKQVAERTTLTKYRIDTWARAGRIPCHRFGRYYRYSEQDVEEIVKYARSTPKNGELARRMRADTAAA
jgi:excisionase family DNA binding protein